ncbi:molybdopterin synthase small subunit [Bremerella volcania]|uniref:Molybdopterin synthase sulfur carrier subunit n=1 Tax=Bremerella volcania TaxID=2527984 RepID=A0A518CAZ4_9BACT|nr:MoaD/ThiS family protein [Bremerella volcania]QDU76370.1 molybdopterin synthase small subunit [Bremerella volcania]
MIVRVKLFALTQDLAGCEEVSLDLEEPVTVGAIRKNLGESVEVLQPVLGSCAFAVNNEYALDSVMVQETDEVACLPPVSGG